MGHLQCRGPMELVYIDFLCLEPDLSGRSNGLVVTDHFTRYAQAYPTGDQQRRFSSIMGCLSAYTRIKAGTLRAS